MFFQRTGFALLATLMLSCLVGLSAPVSARQMQAAGSHVVLDLPENFKPKLRFAGFHARETGATIMVLDLPIGAYAQFTSGFEKVLRDKGYTGVRREELAGRRDDYLYFHAQQMTRAGLFDKYLLIMRDEARAAYITLTVNPVEVTPMPLSRVEAVAILAKARLAARIRSQGASYTLDYLGSFKKQRTITGSTTLYRPKQVVARKTSSAKSLKPLFIVAPSLSRGVVRDLRATGRNLMNNFKRFDDMQLVAEETLRVDGMRAYGVSGMAVNKSNEQLVGVYQLLVANPQGGYFRLVGVAPQRYFPRYLEEFRHMAASFHLTPGE